MLRFDFRAPSATRLALVFEVARDAVTVLQRGFQGVAAHGHEPVTYPVRE